MVENYYQDLWNKAEKLGIKKAHIGAEVFGKNKYRYIYSQGVVSKYMQKRYNEIDEAINRLAKRK